MKQLIELEVIVLKDYIKELDAISVELQRIKMLLKGK